LCLALEQEISVNVRFFLLRLEIVAIIADLNIYMKHIYAIFSQKFLNVKIDFMVKYSDEIGAHQREL
jgi:hypothetical protein